MKPSSIILWSVLLGIILLFCYFSIHLTPKESAYTLPQNNFSQPANVAVHLGRQVTTSYQITKMNTLNLQGVHLNVELGDIDELTVTGLEQNLKMLRFVMQDGLLDLSVPEEAGNPELKLTLKITSLEELKRLKLKNAKLNIVYPFSYDSLYIDASRSQVNIAGQVSKLQIRADFNSQINALYLYADEVEVAATDDAMIVLQINKKGTLMARKDAIIRYSGSQKNVVVTVAERGRVELM